MISYILVKLCTDLAVDAISLRIVVVAGKMRTAAIPRAVAAA